MQITVQLLLTYVCLINQRAIDAQVRSALDNFVVPFRIYQLKFAKTLEASARTRRYRAELERNKKLQPAFGDVPFPCATRDARSPTRPTSVHRLRPGDIDVVGAIGDSLTAGFGANALDLFHVFEQDRGHSFSIGGYGTWRTALTLPNILKEFNPRLVGYSLKTSLTIERASQFNTAEGGAVSDEMPYMAKVLVKRIRKDPRVKLDEDWKMITMMIGANDFCSDICFESPEAFLREHRKDLVETLRIFRDNLPRTIVNLLPPPHLRILRNFTRLPSTCAFVHKVECPCLFGPNIVGREHAFDDLMYMWQAIDLEVANQEEFDLDDFAVVVQPFLLNYTFPTSEGATDYSYLSVDCFHFSQKGHARVANNLWNNLLEPVGRKSLSGGDIMEEFRCPTKERPFIYTRRNSN